MFLKRVHLHLKNVPAVLAVAPTVDVAVAKSDILTVAVAPLSLPVIVELSAKLPVEPLKVKILLSPSNETTVAETDVELESIPVMVSPM